MLAQVHFLQEVDNEENEKQEETSKKRAELLQLREAAFTTLGKAWPRNEQTQGTDNTNCSIRNCCCYCRTGKTFVYTHQLLLNLPGRS